MVGLAPMPFDVLQSAFDPLLPGRPAVVLAGGLLHRDLRRGHRVHRKYGAQLPTGHFHHAPVPDRRRSEPRAAGRDRLRLPRRRLGRRHRRRRPRPGQRGGDLAEWARDYWEELHPTSAGGAYVNFMMDEGQDRVRASYRGNYDAAGPGQAALRPRQHLPHQPEHPPSRRLALRPPALPRRAVSGTYVYTVSCRLTQVAICVIGAEPMYT